MSKFTLGPWKVEEPGNGTLWVTDGPPSTPFLIEVTRKGVDDQDRANARLIAAAPELYELLRALVDTRSKHFIRNEGDGMRGWDERACAALAKVDA